MRNLPSDPRRNTKDNGSRQESRGKSASTVVINDDTIWRARRSNNNKNNKSPLPFNNYPTLLLPCIKKRKTALYDNNDKNTFALQINIRTPQQYDFGMLGFRLGKCARNKFVENEFFHAKSTPRS